MQQKYLWCEGQEHQHCYLSHELLEALNMKVCDDGVLLK
jgi:hypothetical protein